MNLLTKDIESFSSYVDEIVIWCNTPLSEEEKNEIKLLGNITFMGDGHNNGISRAFNKVHIYAKEKGFKYLLTMDQDSVFVNFRQYKDAVINRMENEFCIIGPAQDVIGKLSQDFTRREWCITSGAIFPLTLLEKIGGFHEHFFVDSIDIEICIRARSFRYETYICNKGKLIQQYGAPQKTEILGKELEYTIYSSTRIYEITRNLLLLYRKYHNKKLLNEIKNFSRIFIKAALLNKEIRYSSLLAFCKGLFTGIFGKQIPAPKQ